MKVEVSDSTMRILEATTKRLTTKSTRLETTQPPKKQLRGPNKTPESGVLWPICDLGMFMVLQTTDYGLRIQNIKNLLMPHRYKLIGY